ncbi:hypothetical protein WEN_01190 [Mycoplasma wenyonii str. Massachusetts]|uniref:Uncharacterized protein n=1 Tax=Mycoplasma wenyonii (strain Massachusetts) TaxID=1197325 RepID=I6ZEL7_MYCWM|nr:hypothetical protein [Mycoplasma wenyonii]AFN65037.1 hypothetical protein WEN_01190 [Mycoplasma wenyonii str. Massachusetts]
MSHTEVRESKSTPFFNPPTHEPTPAELYKAKLTSELGLTSEAPRQSKRIFALYKLFSYYLLRSEAKSFIALKIVEIAEKLKNRYGSNISHIYELLKQAKINSSIDLKRHISFINQKDVVELKEGEEQINFLKQLLYYYDKRKEGLLELPVSTLKLNIAALKKIEEDAFECYLRLLDVNFELRNTVIGAENKKLIYFLTQKYVDLHTIIEQSREEFLTELEKLREDLVEEYYDIMRHFSLPSNKLLNFRLFIQKKLESRMYEAQFLKLQASNTINYQLSALENNCSELKRQYLLSLRECSAIVNFYKTRVVKYQTFFSFELEKLITYLKENYLNLINIVFTKLSEAKGYLKTKQTPLEPSELEIIFALEKERLEWQLQELKVKYSKVLVPLISSFDSEIESMEGQHCFNLNHSERRYTALKNLKNKSVEVLVKKFEQEKKRLEEIVAEKEQILVNLEEKVTTDVNAIVEELRDECNTICCDLLRENQYFWAKYNAEFNSASREYFVKLYYEYSPYINSWREGEEGWMQEYLKLKLNLEYLRRIGSSLKEFSPEGKFYEKCANLLDSYSNIFRNVNLQRDKVEYESLIQLNTIPKIDYPKVEERMNRSLKELKEFHSEYLKLINGIIKDNTLERA